MSCCHFQQYTLFSIWYSCLLSKISLCCIASQFILQGVVSGTEARSSFCLDSDNTCRSTERHLFCCRKPLVILIWSQQVTYLYGEHSIKSFLAIFSCHLLVDDSIYGQTTSFLEVPFAKTLLYLRQGIPPTFPPPV